MLLNHSTDAKITNLDIPIFIQKDIVEFNVSVKNRPAVTVCNTEYDLLEYASSFTFIQSSSLFDEL
jgi:hypothetical protein